MSDLSGGEGGPERCLNCGAERLGEFCHWCGQHFREGRLTLGRLVGEAVQRFLSLESGFLLTFREMVVAPGGVIRRFVVGQRKRYVNPITYLLLATALSLLTFVLFRQEVALPELRERLGASVAPLDFTPAQTERYVEIQLAMTERLTWVALALCLPFAVLVRLFFPRSGINLAEAGVFASYVFAQVFFYDSVADLVLQQRSLDAQLWITFGLFAVVGAQASWGFFGHRIWGVVRVLLALALAYFTFSILQVAWVTVYLKRFY